MSRTAVIVGAGPAGLTAAYELQRNSDVRPIVFELGEQVGGISRTINYRGNRMDLGGHRFFSKSDWVMNWWQSMLPVAANQVEGADAAGLRLGSQGSARDFTPTIQADQHDDAVTTATTSCWCAAASPASSIGGGSLIIR